MWDTLDFSCCGIGEGHTEAVGAIAIASRKSTYDSNTAFIITGGGDKVLKRWKFPKEILLKPHQSSLTDDSAEEKKRVVIELQATHSIRAHDKDINAIAVAPNDAIIATGSQDRLVLHKISNII